MGTVAFMGHRLSSISGILENVGGSRGPVNIGIAWIECQIEPTFTVGKDANVYYRISLGHVQGLYQHLHIRLSFLTAVFPARWKRTVMLSL